MASVRRAGVGRLEGEATGIGQHLGRGAEPDDAHDVLDPAPPRPFLLASDDEGFDSQAAPDDQRPDPRRPSQLVRAHRHEVGAELVDIDGDVPGRHARVDVHEGAMAPSHVDDLAHGLDRAHLVIGDLAVHEGGGGPVAGRLLEHLFDRAGLDAPEAVDGDTQHGARSRRRVADRGVLHLGQARWPPPGVPGSPPTSPR